jgi:hypothetical protein
MLIATISISSVFSHSTSLLCSSPAASLPTIPSGFLLVDSVSTAYTYTPALPSPRLLDAHLNLRSRFVRRSTVSLGVLPPLSSSLSLRLSASLCVSLCLSRPCTSPSPHPAQCPFPSLTPTISSEVGEAPIRTSSSLYIRSSYGTSPHRHAHFLISPFLISVNLDIRAIP